jgi:hypothetical protein
MKLFLPGVIVLCLSLVAFDKEQTTAETNHDQVQNLTGESALPATPHIW